MTAYTMSVRNTNGKIMFIRIVILMKVQYLVVIAAAALIAAGGMLFNFTQNNENTPDEGYLYALYTDSEKNLDIIDVYESHFEDGKATSLTQRYRSSESLEGINPFWQFDKDTGTGPFGTFYAAINLMNDGKAYDTDDQTEKRRSTSVGYIAYVLDPYDLNKTLAGNPFTQDLYNVMLMIPTVYWISNKVVADATEGNLVKGTEYNVLYVSSSSSYTPSGHERIEGMKAYAHSASTTSGKTDFETSVYPYLGIGVYESYATKDSDPAGAGKLVSQSGKIPAAQIDVDGFKALADALTPAASKEMRSDYQQWNYYQWTLYKIMCYTIMGSKNSQVMVDPGFTEENTSCAVTGSTDNIGFIGAAESTLTAEGTISTGKGKTAAKLFIENGWGSLNVFVGDAFVTGESHDAMYLHTGNYLGGENLIETRTQPSSMVKWADVYRTGERHRVIAGASTTPAVWDTPILADANRDAYTDTAFPGDIVNAAEEGVFSLTAGGRWDNTYYAGTAFICAGYDIGLNNEYRGARLAYLLSEHTG